MLDENVVGECRPLVASDIHHLVVVEQRNFGMQGLAVARDFAAYMRCAFVGSVAAWHGLAEAEGVAG